MAEEISLDPVRLVSNCETNQAASYTSPSPPPAPYLGPILPLDGRNTRILVLDPVTNVTGSESLQLAGSLVVRGLDEHPDFAALSYVWGKTTATPPHHIDIRDGPGGERLGSIPLMDNCFHALAELQKDPTRRALWVDAVCINQADCTEKGHQVRYMGDIYSLAKTTYIWLRPGHAGRTRPCGTYDSMAKSLIDWESGWLWQRLPWIGRSRRPTTSASSGRTRKECSIMTR